MSSEQTNTVFYNYPVFRLGRRLSFILSKSVNSQSCFMAVLFTVLFLTGSLIDQTLIMKGRDIGLLEHPTTWAFLIIQIIAPIFLNKGVEKLFTFLKKNDIIYSKKELSGYLSLFTKHTSRQANFGKFCYTFLTLVGIICFAWNSFQNQNPLRFLGFDFWDSFNHPFGYWVTRIYKLYLWVFFLPAIIHIHISILFVLHKLLKDSTKENFFVLRPYNQDEHAGVGVIIKIAITPPIPILILGSLSVLGAFIIHGQTGITPLIGLCLVSLLLILIYLIPAIQLRRIIKSEKKRQLTEITEKQNELYFELVKDVKAKNETDILETLNSLTTVFDQVKSISIWPYWKSMLKIVGIINIPVIISIGKSLWPVIKSKWLTVFILLLH